MTKNQVYVEPPKSDSLFGGWHCIVLDGQNPVTKSATTRIRLLCRDKLSANSVDKILQELIADGKIQFIL